jgi:hypothetical protein
MHVRALGFTFTLHDGLLIEGVAPVAGPPQDPTEVRLDPERVAGRRPARTDDDGPVLRITEVAGDGWLVDARGVGAALVSADGRAVWCAPQAGSGDWTALLGAQVVPLVATLRGHEVFHASGVVIDDRAHLLCAARGVGKTSLAAHLVLAGAELLADDVVAVDDMLVAHPGPVVLNVRAPERAGLEVGGQAAGFRWDADRRGRGRLTVERTAGPRPLGGIHLLGRYRAGAPIVALTPPRPVDLLAATFNLSVRTPERLVRQLGLCARIAAEIPVTRLRITPGRDAPALAAELLAHLRPAAEARR